MKTFFGKGRMPTSALFEALALRADVGIGPYKKSRQGRWSLHTDDKRAAQIEPLMFLYTRKFTATGSKYFFQYQPFRIRNINVTQIAAILQGSTFITGNGIPGIIDNNGYIGVKAAGGRSGEQGHFLFFSVQNLNYCGKFFCR